MASWRLSAHHYRKPCARRATASAYASRNPARQSLSIPSTQSTRRVCLGLNSSLTCFAICLAVKSGCRLHIAAIRSRAAVRQSTCRPIRFCIRLRPKTSCRQPLISAQALLSRIGYSSRRVFTIFIPLMSGHRFKIARTRALRTRSGMRSRRSRKPSRHAMLAKVAPLQRPPIGDERCRSFSFWAAAWNVMGLSHIPG
jgi:hypothetical protein